MKVYERYFKENTEIMYFNGKSFGIDEKISISYDDLEFFGIPLENNKIKNHKSWSAYSKELGSYETNTVNENTLTKVLEKIIKNFNMDIPYTLNGFNNKHLVDDQIGFNKQVKKLQNLIKKEGMYGEHLEVAIIRIICLKIIAKQKNFNISWK